MTTRNITVRGKASNISINVTKGPRDSWTWHNNTRTLTHATGVRIVFTEAAAARIDAAVKAAYINVETLTGLELSKRPDRDEWLNDPNLLGGTYDSQPIYTRIRSNHPTVQVDTSEILSMGRG